MGQWLSNEGDHKQLSMSHDFQGKMDHKEFWPTCLLSSHICEAHAFSETGKLITTNMHDERNAYCPVSPLAMSKLVFLTGT